MASLHVWVSMSYPFLLECCIPAIVSIMGLRAAEEPVALSEETKIVYLH